MAVFDSTSASDIRTVQRREHLRLPLEQNHALGIVRKQFMQDFDATPQSSLLWWADASRLWHRPRSTRDLMGSYASPNGQGID